MRSACNMPALVNADERVADNDSIRRKVGICRDRDGIEIAKAASHFVTKRFLNKRSFIGYLLRTKSERYYAKDGR